MCPRTSSFDYNPDLARGRVEAPAVGDGLGNPAVRVNRAHPPVQGFAARGRRVALDSDLDLALHLGGELGRAVDLDDPWDLERDLVEQWHHAQLQVESRAGNGLHRGAPEDFQRTVAVGLEGVGDKAVAQAC
jgi:hypothetical protein